METVLVFILAVALSRVFCGIHAGFQEKAVCVGLIMLYVLTYLVSLIPIVLWPVIMWMRN